jgi:hypothetical protein
VPQQLGAEHRRQAEREEARKGDRADHRHGELPEQQAGLAGDEHDRHEHGADHQRGRDDREADLARALERGGERRLAFLDAVIDILEHDDGVVDDDADRQHHRQQVSRLIEKPNIHSTAKLASRQSGTVTAGSKWPASCRGTGR